MKRELNIIQPNSHDQACCEPSVHTTLNREQVEQAATAFAALADPTRLTILNLLAESRDAVCVCDITESFTLGQPTISHHLKILRDAGLINGDKRGKWVYYSLVRGRTEEIKTLLDQVFKSPLFV
jgi:ArsR family transcriptional regulator